MTDFFKDKNILALYPAENSGFPMRFTPLKRYFRSVHLLNYAQTCHTEGIKNTERRIRNIITEKKIDITLCCPFASDYQLSVDFYSSLRKKLTTVFWFADDPTYFESYNRYYAQTADAVITADYFASFAYKRLEIQALVCQDLTASNKYFPVKINKDIDVCFIGDMSKRGRREYVEFLRNAGVAVTVYGQGSSNGYLPVEKISEYFCRSRINLNFSRLGDLEWRNADEPLLNRVRQNTGRPREIALTGSFCLSEYSPALETVFKLGEEMDFFRDKAELLEKVRFYLANPEKREALALAAHEYAVKNYREEIYIPRMLENMACCLSNAGGANAKADKIYLSRNFKIREINSLTFSMCVMAKNRKLKAAFETFHLLFKHGLMIFLSGFTGGMRRVIRNILVKLTTK
ncbi:MAG: glycosyltransferase [Elusimicrobiota bacterium]